jgi:hypothetical protein
MTTLRVCLLAALLVPAAASAKKPADKEPAPQVLTYGDGDEIEGGTLGPDGNAVNAKGKTRFSSLVKVRTTFIPELIKSAQNY